MRDQFGSFLINRVYSSLYDQRGVDTTDDVCSESQLTTPSSDNHNIEAALFSFLFDYLFFSFTIVLILSLLFALVVLSCRRCGDKYGSIYTSSLSSQYNLLLLALLA